MADKKQRRGKGSQQSEPEGPTKLEKDIATYVYNKCPKKQTLFFSDKVYYFIGSKAVDALMESKWAKGTKKEDAILKDRDACADYLSGLMHRGMFIRAEKIVVKKVEKKDKDKKSDKAKSGKEDTKSIKEKGAKKEEGEKSKKDKKKDQDKAASEEKSESSEEDGKAEKKGREKRKKIRLEQHSKQLFLDSNDAYVWTYEPTSVRNIILGLGLVFGAIGVCLFPLWPPIVRQGVYYLSLVMVGLIGVLIAVSLLRYVAFAAVWVLTGGNLHFWYLPNLTEDCGFLESFAPIYSSTTKQMREDKAKEKAAKKAKKTRKDADEPEETEKLIGDTKAEPEPPVEQTKPEEQEANNSDDDFEVIETE